MTVSRTRLKEIVQFSGVGISTAILDYALLNVFASWLKLPVVAANLISAPIASIVNYHLNKEVVFHDKMHSETKSLLRYAAIMAVGIVVIQNAVLWVLTSTVLPAESIIAINLAKLIAIFVASIWNYFMQRKFVFVTEEEKENQKSKSR